MQSPLPMDAKTGLAVKSQNPPPNCSFLPPTVAVLAFGALVFPSSVPIGILAGAGSFVATIVVLVASRCFQLFVEDEEAENKQYSHTEMLQMTLTGPLIEEVIFRGGIQPLGTRAILWLIPAASALCLGTSLTIACCASIFFTAVLFGLAHLTNKHKNTHIQAYNAFKGGVIYGFLSVHFGLLAAIAAHMVHNTLGLTISQIPKVFQRCQKTITSPSQGQLEHTFSL